MNKKKYKNLKKSEIPLITIGITCFNAEKTIARALQSGLTQDWENIEIIIVNDGSTDNSRKILESFSSTKNNLKLINHPQNMGCAHSRNSIISNSIGEYIAFFDDDDVSRFDRISLQYKALLKYEEENQTNLVVCFASGQKIYKNNYTKSFLSAGINGLPPVGLQMANYLLFFEQIQNIAYGSGVPTCSLFARKSTFLRVGIFDTQMSRQEDVDFGIRLAIKGAHFIGIKQPVITQFTSSKDYKTAKVEYQSSLYLIEKYSDYLNSKGLYEYMKLWIKIKYQHFISNNFYAFLILLKLFLKYPVRTIKHFGKSASRRFIHESLMNSNSKLIKLFQICGKFLNQNISFKL